MLVHVFYVRLQVYQYEKTYYSKCALILKIVDQEK